MTCLNIDSQIVFFIIILNQISQQWEQGEKIDQFVSDIPEPDILIKN